MEQDSWKLILDYLSAKEQGKVQELADLEERLQSWLRKDALNKQELERAIWLWESTAILPQDESWNDSFTDIKRSAQTEKNTKRKTFIIWSAVAAAVVAIAIFILFNKAQESVISNRQITWVTKISVPGKITNIILPDSSEIWLNAGSKISFPDNFNQDSIRMVKLIGEAFFKVKRDPKHPFVVHSSNIQTRVLGTSFNISAWENSAAEVTVLTGKVAVSRDSVGGQSQAIHLLPNQRVMYDLKSEELHLERIEDANLAIGWTKGKMAFNQTPIEEVFEIIERRYGVHIKTDDSFKACKLTAKFDNVNINEVLKTIQVTLDIQYTIKNQTIYIKGGKCN